MSLDLRSRLLDSLREDGAFDDITSSLLSRGKTRRTRARLYARAAGIFCGSFLLRPIFLRLDPKARFSIRRKDGARVKRGDVLAEIRASTAAILAGERLYLNLASRLSGIATLTRRYVDAAGARLAVFDTRKTTPLWRDLERAAVRCGGGNNHRFSLSDAILVKDNHLAALRDAGVSLAEALQRGGRARKRASFVLVEATSRRDVWAAVKARADIVMLDNMNARQIRESVDMIRASRKALGTKTPLIEVSGGVQVADVRRLAARGVDRVSVGALTHSAPALDLSLEVE